MDDRTTQPADPRDLAGETDKCDFHVVAVGASAGGLEALEQFFKPMPTDLGVAFVVVQHLSPDFKSHMEQLLARQTAMPIFRVENGMEVRPNSIYLIPPRKEMIISKRKLLLTDREPGKSLSHPIDLFLRSVANDLGRRSVGVILSGTGSDGSRGIRDIHEAGGLVLCQDEDSAGFNGMPVNAQETGAVDLILPPETMAASLERYVTGSLSPDVLAAQELGPSQLEGVERVFELLRHSYGIDFSNYKPATISRRIKRRMTIQHISGLETYTETLRDDAEELDRLYRDLLIGVTQFFRDPEFFERLEDEVVPELLERVERGEPVRAWVAACATGEEAYSLAIVIHEQMTQSGRTPNAKIFATDVHQRSLDHAAKGWYPDSALAEMPPVRRDRYFTREADGWQVSPELRQMIVFAPHNLVQDAPFTQLDLVTCRNLLIYLQPTAQKKALSFFHFALRMGGVLALGPSESTGDLADEFTVIDKRWKVYRKRRDTRLPADMRLDFAAQSLRMPRTALAGGSTRNRGFDQQLLSSYDRLLALKMPPSFLIDESGELLHTFGGAERLLRPVGGRPSTALVDLIDPDLRTSVSAATQHALRDGSVVRYTGVRHRAVEGPEERLRLVVQPISDPKTGTLNLLVEFEPAEPVTPVAGDASASVAPEPVDVSLDQLTRDHVTALETELRSTQENLQATVEELETANEELQASNEELVASNEELQSTNEELHSVNEELYTVNAEHQRKIDELTRVTEDLDNLLASIQVGVVFLDQGLRVRRYTPNVADNFNLLPQDLGRRIDAFSSRLDYERLTDDLQSIVDGGPIVEQEVRERDGRRHLMRLLPYRSPSSSSGGVLLTLVDIESLKRAEGNRQQSEDRFRLLLHSTAEGVIGMNRDGVCDFVNRSAIQLLGCTDESELLGSDLCQYIHQSGKAGQSDCDVCDALVTGEPVHDDSATFRRADGAGFVAEYWSHPIERDDKVHGAVMTFFDVTERRAVEKQLHQARQAAETASRAKSSFLANMSHELRTPLSAILGFADILLAEIDDDTNRERIGTIRRNGAFLLELLNDILDLSKIEAGKLMLQPEPVEIVKLMSDVAKLMRVRAEAKDLELHFELKSAIPRVMQTDSRRFRQVLVNLLGNAVKFTERGEVTITAGVPPANPDAEGTPDPHLVIEVADTGVGIETQELQKIFKPFEQAEKRLTGSAGGTGLGLSISRLLARELGGEIDVRSTAGVGSRFTLTLPLTAPCDDWIDPDGVSDVVASNQDDRESGDDHRLDGRLIVVADDRRDIRHVAEYFLTRGGAEVVLAEDGQQAIEAVEREATTGRRVDLVLMDMQMPVLDGYEATKALVATGFHRPIIALTAAAMKGERERCLAAGCTDYLTKPIDGTTLVEVCAACLAKADHGERVGS